ncbi:hypothetical protein PM076_07440 [Halorubrum ezzemoulense]|uniref:Uncharacterized protein n=1 Tax=Halorubrum ezzemoulense TaxID=337243 RepID=A0ABT4YZ93_HALEZ|nr:hypothetical protein [Halorubrum ezzemoulense]MDB2243308.1 hypothetical protein [Halorubrum ezzemoulense]MDB2277043.1 hypothetical protein [Halorubrum ezzemoulense]MDB2288670.1 hypothetical protein [Halorubrum ezzemoulense]MDB2291223.1 hypothetical protein [Halorubrum ezzemoulense]MDB2296141.1 hypothetical protein [Halorubrum ezzemoulense]
MATQDSTSQYRFNLKEGDLIETTITKLGGGDHQVDTSRWANIETANIAEFTDPRGVQLGSDLHVVVKDIEEDFAELEQAEHVYQRHHRPGDTLRVRIVEKYTSKLYRAKPDRSRNLEKLYAVGVELGADVTVEIVKVRNGTAIATPCEVHQKGVSTGVELDAKTTAGSQYLLMPEDVEQDITAALSGVGGDIKLADPARATSTARVEIVDISKDEVVCRIQDYSVDKRTELPSTGEAVRTGVNKGDTETTVSLSDGVSIAVKLNERAPCTGNASITLTGVSRGTYVGSIKRYMKPHLKIGDKYSAKIHGYTHKATIESGEYQIPIKLENEISATGKGTVEITEIADSVRGRIVGGVEETAGSDNSSDVDLTNLSKL